MQLISIAVFVLSVNNIIALKITVPGVRAKVDDDYICTAKYVGDRPSYVTGFQPLFNKNVTHHMILSACDEPFSEEPYWHCNMEVDSKGVCHGPSATLYSWADGAPPMQLPEDVSFPIGVEGRKYIVLQVHYKDVEQFDKDPELKDSSGYKLTVEFKPTEKLAGIYVLMSNGEILPHSKTTLQIGCVYNGYADIHPFAFRVHAHKHGVLIDGHVIHENRKYLIGEKSPQLPQTYYPTGNASMVIMPGDTIMARCVMENDEDRTISMGMSRKDEMCNFYLMYWVDKTESSLLFDRASQTCVSDGNFEEMEKVADEMDDMIEKASDELMSDIELW